MAKEASDLHFTPILLSSIATGAATICNRATCGTTADLRFTCHALDPADYERCECGAQVWGSSTTHATAKETLLFIEFPYGELAMLTINKELQNCIAEDLRDRYPCGTQVLCRRRPAATSGFVTLQPFPSAGDDDLLPAWELPEEDIDPIPPIMVAKAGSDVEVVFKDIHQDSGGHLEAACEEEEPALKLPRGHTYTLRWRTDGTKMLLRTMKDSKQKMQLGTVALTREMWAAGGIKAYSMTVEEQATEIEGLVYAGDGGPAVKAAQTYFHEFLQRFFPYDYSQIPLHHAGQGLKKFMGHRRARWIVVDGHMMVDQNENPLNFQYYPGASTKDLYGDIAGYLDQEKSTDTTKLIWLSTCYGIQCAKQIVKNFVVVAVAWDSVVTQQCLWHHFRRFFKALIDQGGKQPKLRDIYVKTCYEVRRSFPDKNFPVPLFCDRKRLGLLCYDWTSLRSSWAGASEETVIEALEYTDEKIHIIANPTELARELHHSADYAADQLLVVLLGEFDLEDDLKDLEDANFKGTAIVWPGKVKAEQAQSGQAGLRFIQDRIAKYLQKPLQDLTFENMQELLNVEEFEDGDTVWHLYDTTDFAAIQEEHRKKENVLVRPQTRDFRGVRVATSGT